MLGALDAAGVPVLVVPGNHDVLNPRAARFSGDAAEPVAGVAPEEFAAIHADLGYGEALERDPASLSYVAEPVPACACSRSTRAGTGTGRAARGPTGASRGRPGRGRPGRSRAPGRTGPR